MIRPLLAIGLVGVLAGALALACWLVEARAPRVAGADTVLVVDGAEYDRAAFERFHGRAAVFPDAASAERALQRFADQLLLAGADPVHAAPVAVSDLEVQAWYAEHRDRYVRGPRVRLAWFGVARQPDEASAREAIRALHVRSQLEQRPEQLDRLLANPGPGVRTRQAGRLDCGAEAPAGVPTAVLAAGCTLADGALSAPIETPEAFYVVRRTASEPGRYRSLSDARGEIRARLERDVAVRTRRERLAALRAEADVWIPEPALEGLVVAPSARPVAEGPPRLPGRSS